MASNGQGTWNPTHYPAPVPQGGDEPRLESGWIPNPEQKTYAAGAADCCSRTFMVRNESVVNHLCGHRSHEGCIRDLWMCYTLGGCRACCEKSTSRQRHGK